MIWVTLYDKIGTLFITWDTTETTVLIDAIDEVLEACKDLIDNGSTFWGKITGSTLVFTNAADIFRKVTKGPSLEITTILINNGFYGDVPQIT